MNAGLFRKESGEFVLVSTFILISLVMFVKSFSYAPDIATFPQFTAGVVIVIGLIIMAHSYLPDYLEEFVMGGEEISYTDSNVEEPVSDDEGDGHREIGVLSYSIPVSIYTSVLGLLLVIGSYLFSILLISPLFTFAYLYPLGYSWRNTILMSLFVLLINVIFLVLFDVRVGEAVLI